MILITGGAYQGKTDYAKENYGITDAEICDLTQGFDPQKRCYTHLEQYVLSCMRAGTEISFPQDCIVICDDISCGVVPMDAEIRAWREQTGRTLNALAAQAERVVRIFCGLELILK